MKTTENFGQGLGLIGEFGALDILRGPLDGFIYRLNRQAIWEVLGSIETKSKALHAVIWQSSCKDGKWEFKPGLMLYSAFLSPGFFGMHLEYLGTVRGFHDIARDDKGSR